MTESATRRQAGKSEARSRKPKPPPAGYDGPTVTKRRRGKRNKVEQPSLTLRFLTIEEFCTEHRLSRTHYFNLKKDDKGPAEYMVGGKILISQEAAAAWRAKVAAGELEQKPQRDAEEHTYG